MAVPLLRPGDTNDAVPRMKRALVRELVALGLRPLAEVIDLESKTYGSAAEKGVRKFQAKKNLDPDGVVGEKTWRALGINEPVVDAGVSVNGGRVIVAAGANLPGKPIQPMTLNFIEQMAGLFGKPITITTGTNHSKFTVNGNVSDHFTGHAADIGMAANGGGDDSPVGDRIMEAALIVAGVPRAQAGPQARGGGLFNFTHNGERIQCIWKTNLGGNHHNHVHVGVRPA
ncbi:MAG TPA: peptidoglycan-binding protein [Gaiellaceae bacterium]